MSGEAHNVVQTGSADKVIIGTTHDRRGVIALTVVAIALVLAVVSVVLVASFSHVSNSAPNPTSTPTVVPPPITPPTGNPLFVDNFDDNVIGAWQLFVDGSPSTIQPTNGTLTLSSRHPHLIQATSGGINSTVEKHADTIMQVNVRAAGQGEYGASCRYGNRLAYKFAIKNTGSAGIFKVNGPQVEPIPGSGFRATDFRTTGFNKLTTVCQNVGGSVHLELWINGALVSSVTDSVNPLAIGTVTLYANADDQQTLTVEFDNLKLETL